MTVVKKHPLEITLILIIATLHIPVVFSHSNYLLTWFNTDDAFYYFKTAQHVVAGNGFTFDGIARTNGFHPLWMFAVIPFFAPPGPYLPLRLLVGLLLLLNTGSALLLYRLARRCLSPSAAFLTVLAFSLLPAIHGVTTRGGMESGINAFFIILLLHQLGNTDGKTLRGALLLSGIAALTFLARLDNVFLAYLTGLGVLLKGWNPPRGGGDSPPWLWRLRLALACFGPLTFVVLVYMGWNWIGFGTPTPVSGQVKRWWGTLPNTVYGFPPKRWVNFIGQFFTGAEGIGPWSIITGPFYASAENLLTFLGLEITIRLRRLALAGLGLASAGVVGFLTRRNRKFVRAAVRGFGLIPLLFGCLFQITYYKAGGSVAERGWYWVGEMLFVVLAGGTLIESLYRTLPRKIAIRNRQFPNYKLLITLPIAALLIIPHLSRIPRITNPPESSFYLRRADWLEAHTEPGARIAMTGSGSSGYFTNGRTLINLDGLINSYEYFQQMQNGTAHEYLASIGVDYVFGSPYIVQESDPYGVIFENRLEQDAIFQDGDKALVLWRFVP
ncbi:MAG: hypothetical protein ACE5GO_01215 [Anaerolineales bacterium]